MDLPPFIRGLELSSLFFEQAVRPLLAQHFPKLTYSAARLDYGSDVLGFDTPQSRDHHWGPRLALYLDERDLHLKDAIHHALANHLPLKIAGYPTHFTFNIDADAMTPAASHPIKHGVDITTVSQFFLDYTGFDATRTLSEVDWLLIPSQRLATIASGRIFHDDLGTLTSARAQLGWYPQDVWLYILASQWRRIDQEQPFTARTGDVGDEIGSRLVASRQVRDMMRLAFLMERRHAPYIKWFGTACARLSCATRLLPIFHDISKATDWKQREEHLCRAWLIVQELHNALHITPPLEVRIGHFFSRPYRVPHAGRFVDALQEAITSPAVRAFPKHLGSIDQWCDNTDVLEDAQRCRSFATLFR
jgi:hypothetical protein